MTRNVMVMLAGALIGALAVGLAALKGKQKQEAPPRAVAEKVVESAPAAPSPTPATPAQEGVRPASGKFLKSADPSRGAMMDGLKNFLCSEDAALDRDWADAAGASEDRRERWGARYLLLRPFWLFLAEAKGAHKSRDEMRRGLTQLLAEARRGHEADLAELKTRSRVSPDADLERPRTEAMLVRIAQFIEEVKGK